jgi:acetaldehyde dehydrogenase (acetylating)
MGLDKDLASIQETRDLCKRAKKAQLEFKNYTQEQVDKIVKAIADAGFAEAERLGKMAHEETGFGKWQDKKAKNIFGTKTIYESIKDVKTVGVINSLFDGKLLEIAEPMGVVAALIPSTNPTSTSFYKILISVKARNAIVASPHPRSVKCSLEAFRVAADAAEKAGAPQDLINCISNPTMEGTSELMKNKDVAIILATGNTPMVKAAYSSGKPAYGVGPGNDPAFIERTANVKKAVADICTGKTFDNGVLCSTESSVVVDSPIESLVREEFKKHGGYFVNTDEKIKLEKIMFNRGALNPDMVGKPAAFIAQKAGFNVPPNTEILIAEISGVGKDYPLSAEKLSPVLSYFVVDGWREGCEKCIQLLEFGGIGHTMVIHSTDKDIIMKFALEKPAFRFLVNTVGTLGAAGFTNHLTPALTLGCGTIGGSIISLNVTAIHLLNIKRVAFETSPMNDKNGVAIDQSGSKPNSSSVNNIGKSWMDEIEDRIRSKAGNPPFAKNDEKIIEKTNVKSGKIFGSGMTEAEVENVMRSFRK